ncbi:MULTISPECIES: ROK family transcriptional regulator [unclassified Leifsonia]|uniref:ROK family transcriptional regulator n=1 Tax=unclassified Leifsonia TaxID=2663824 RepID=UPI0008A7EFA9|nr:MULTISPECIES: ROK family transcriptional regulator [unclassified Leifsonia]SEI14657.1 Sugar kinase of the NBD/HSP70 family, may contain an N-terminal HTH domain [Leifsonia sp. CL154]SFM02352.1 Sugar kinase of the NBD/HSP70 family, may contain an N-terminal HTH domain [Leifsonia sp. CL147]
MSSKASVKDVRRNNRAILLRHLLLAGRSSRSEAGAATALSPATVTSVIAELIDEGVILETGSIESDGGRPRTLLELNDDAAYVFGADVGEFSVTVGLFTLRLERVAERVVPFPQSPVRPEDVTEAIEAAIEDLRGHVPPGVPILGLGLGVPGIVQKVRSESGTVSRVVHAQVIGWESVSFDSLSSRIGMRVYVDNGAKSTTQAELWFGAARGVEEAAVVLIGNGAGAGIVSAGALTRGSNSSAGEWGHTKISLDGQTCLCGSRGCVMTFVGADAVLERWRGVGVREPGRELVELAALFDRWRAGDSHAASVVDTLVHHLGVALSNLVNLYNPQMIVISGWFGDVIADNLLEEVERSVRAFSLEQPGQDVLLERSRLRRDAVALGAATLPLDQFITTGWPHHTNPLFERTPQ